MASILNNWTGWLFPSICLTFSFALGGQHLQRPPLPERLCSKAAMQQLPQRYGSAVLLLQHQLPGSPIQQTQQWTLHTLQDDQDTWDECLCGYRQRDLRHHHGVLPVQHGKLLCNRGGHLSLDKFLTVTPKQPFTVSSRPLVMLGCSSVKLGKNLKHWEKVHLTSALSLSNFVFFAENTGKH